VTHSLRHTFASHFMMSGGSILTLQKLLGHSSLDVTLIYAHLAPDFMASEVSKLDFNVPVAGVTPITTASGSG
jgi:site-specific recombinase XerD